MAHESAIGGKIARNQEPCPGKGHTAFILWGLGELESAGCSGELGHLGHGGHALGHAEAVGHAGEPRRVGRALELVHPEGLGLVADGAHEPRHRRGLWSRVWWRCVRIQRIND